MGSTTTIEAEGYMGAYIREVLMVIYGSAWLVVVLLTAWRTGSVPAELWAGLGVGEGALMALFRADEALRRRTNGQRQQVGDSE